MANSLQMRFLAIGLTAFLLSGASVAEDKKGSPEARALIERQLDAFAHDDGPAAYAIAAPAIKSIFADPNVFLSMVRQQYTPVYRHRSVEFGPVEADTDSMAQVVTFVDENNQVWKALYKLARQPDGSWLISGCSLVKSDDKST